MKTQSQLEKQLRLNSTPFNTVSPSVEWLEGPHEPKHYSADDLKEIKAKYTALARELEKQIS
ncbi:hypothetical protein ACI3PL_23545 [Lacticaseibacillus paracasei]